MTTQGSGDTMAMNSDGVNYDNGYQEQRQDKGMADAGNYITQVSLPATQEPLVPPSPVAPSPVME